MSANSGKGGSPFVSNFFRASRRRRRTLPLVQQLQWADYDDAGATVLNDWMWDTSAAPGGQGQIKVHNGSGWDIKPVKVWNGSAWVTKPLKRWNGSAWVETNY